MTMKPHVAAPALCALLISLPAAAQQDQPRSMAPSRAEPVPTSSPLPDPHKDGGRPESHGGTVHAPQVDATAPLPADVRGTAESLARNAIMAQQYGNLASKRHGSGAIHELGDQMALTNSRINRALTAAAPDLRDVQIPEKQRGTFDALARDADEMQFGISVAQWVAQSYPKAISDLQTLGRQSQFRELAESALPAMKAQLSDAERILQNARNEPSGKPTATGTVNDPKKQSD
jgi:hypothetical protein